MATVSGKSYLCLCPRGEPTGGVGEPSPERGSGSLTKYQGPRGSGGITGPCKVLARDPRHPWKADIWTPWG